MNIPGSIQSDGGSGIQYMPVEEILWKFSRPNANGCLIWQLSTKVFGHGHINIRLPSGKKTSRNVHRWIYERLHGEIPAGKVVCHSCDEPACINPSHLFLGTQVENLRDAKTKGRHDHYLSPAQINEIRRLTKDGMSQRALGRLFGVAKSSIARWQHSTDYMEETNK